jgi:adenosylcobyric acid synthase
MRSLAKTLMLQGTASSVGKSLLTAALCRIFRQDGLRVAPFKAQNMSLNAAVTPDGGEIGRAQAVQAESAGIPPTVEMNPILLKPEGGMRSQVIVKGKSAGSMTWGEYQRERTEWLAIVDDCVAKLRREFDVILIEGAGSPAEINLRAQDLVNMHVATVAEARVLLVGDIDRGGVFAHLAGTMELLPPDERERIAGFVINKFRGDAALLKPALDYLASRYRVPVVGVVPFIERLRIAEEDSVDLENRSRAASSPGELQIAVIRLPSISNYDDFSALEHEPGVAVSYVDSTDGLSDADLAIIPGSKSTMKDLAWLRRAGIDRALLQRANHGALILGVCGGCQMLGETILDPGQVESDALEVPGLGLLPLTTRFEPAKRTTQVRAYIDAKSFLGDGTTGQIDAYEIHMGPTRAHDGTASPFRLLSRNGDSCDARDGAISANGATVGTMLHGIFENDALRAAMLNSLRSRNGLAASDGIPVASREAEYDRLADVVRASLDIAKIKNIVGIT